MLAGGDKGVGSCYKERKKAKSSLVFTNLFCFDTSFFPETAAIIFSAIGFLFCILCMYSIHCIYIDHLVTFSRRPVTGMALLGQGIYRNHCSSTSRGSEWQLITPFEWLFA